MTLANLAASIPALSKKPHSEQITLFGWYLHVHKAKTHFQAADVKQCYEALHHPAPSSFGGYFDNLCKQKRVIRTASGYRLSAEERQAYDLKYGKATHVIQVTKLLADLPAKIPDLAERTYLEETYTCYTHEAFRAAIVMTWNLAYHHLCDYVLKNKLIIFNARWLVSYPGHHRKGNRTIAKMDDFGEELKESEVLIICKDSGIITKDVYKILDEKLGKRNSAAHPSSVSIGQLQANAFIDDLVKNVVLKLI